MRMREREGEERTKEEKRETSMLINATLQYRVRDAVHQEWGIHPAELTLGLHIDLAAVGTLEREPEENSS